MPKVSKGNKNWLNVFQTSISRLKNIIFSLICALGLIGLLNQIEMTNPEVSPTNDRTEI